MGYICHHAIIVTTYTKEYIEKARNEFERISSRHDWDYHENLKPSEIMVSLVNAYYTFIIPPDGSKEGWGLSVVGNECRLEFTEWLTAQCFEDGSSPYSWALVQYGDEYGDNKILEHD
jgi:hypothetical protein